LNEAAAAPPVSDPVPAAGSGASPAYEASIKRLGPTDYAHTWRAMQAFTDARTADTRDEIWLTEHASVYTLGLAGRREHVLRESAIPILKVDRGGQVTYHGPGQLLVYVLIDVGRRKLGVRQLVVAIESAVIKLLRSYGIDAYGRRDAPGVYVERAGREAKIAALGLRVRHGCTYHGFALNLDMDLKPFDDIDPCGYRGLAVAQLSDFGVDVRGTRTGIEDRLVSHVIEAIAGLERKR
jgi:lipoyl(octanoyl) transferase